MKKRFFAIATAVAFALSFTACDGEEGLAELIESTNLTGHITLYTSNPSGAQQWGANDTLTFKSAVTNVKFDTIQAFDTTIAAHIDAGTVMIATTDNVLTSGNNANITFPLAGINLRGNTATTYTISCPIDDIEFFRQFDTTGVMQMITSGIDLGGQVGNLFAVAVDSNHFYLGYEGSVVISSFGEEGSLVEGTVNNVRAIYVTDSQIEQLANGTLSSADLPTITFNGVISSRRTNIEALISALDEMGNEEQK